VRQTFAQAWARYVAATADARRHLRDWGLRTAADPRYSDFADFSADPRALQNALRAVHELIVEVQHLVPYLEDDRAKNLRLRLTTVDAYLAPCTA